MTKFGATGPEVQALQVALLQLGYEAVKANGVFDVRTDEAVRHLQRSFGYNIDGTGSNATWALIKQQQGYKWNQQRSPTPLVVLARGSKGDAVLAAQKLLVGLAYVDVPLSGQFEVHTYEAVRHLQNAFGYVVDGVVGEAVRFLLTQQIGLQWNQQKSKLPLRTLTAGCSGEDVLQLQKDLQRLGFLSCKSTGTFDADTEASVRELQKAFGYNIDGTCSDAVRFLVRQQLGYGWFRQQESKSISDTLAHIDKLAYTPERVSFSPVQGWYYGHGAFMGAAPALVADAKWRRILGFLMPDVFAALRAKIEEGADPSALVPMMENNPVQAAYGTFEAARVSAGKESANHLVGLEWDLFVDVALIEAHAQAKNETEQASVMDKVLDTALIAHGGAMDTVFESLGVCQYNDVRLTPKTEYGGVEMDSWLDLFGRALALARSENVSQLLETMSQEPRSEKQEACMAHTFAKPWSVERVVREYEQVTKRPCLSIVIDIKSINSTPAFLSALVQHLNRKGVHVAGIGSFLREEIEGVSKAEQRVGRFTLPGPAEVWFFHFAGDLQAACAEGRVPAGQHVLFNGACLLEAAELTAKETTYQPRRNVVDGVEALRQKHQLRIGLYVQEGDCDGVAADALSKLLLDWPNTFELGFAWGGLRNEAHVARGTLPRLGHGSQALLMLVGKARDWEASPTANA